MLGKMDFRKKETMIQASLIVIGSLAYSIGLNMLITPLALYNGGFMGIAQLIRTFMVSVLHIKMPPGMDIAGAIYYILNVPLFYMGYRIMGKGFLSNPFLVRPHQYLSCVGTGADDADY